MLHFSDKRRSCRMTYFSTLYSWQWPHKELSQIQMVLTDFQVGVKSAMTECIVTFFDNLLGNCHYFLDDQTCVGAGHNLIQRYTTIHNYVAARRVVCHGNFSCCTTFIHSIVQAVGGRQRLSIYSNDWLWVSPGTTVCKYVVTIARRH